MPKFTGKYRSRAPDLNTEFIPAIKPGRACTPGKGAKLGPCNTQVVFLSKEAAAKAGTQPGPNLRFCVTKGKPGRLVPVSSPREATQLAKQYCECVKKKGATGASCSAKLGKSSGFGARVASTEDGAGFAGREGRSRGGLAGYGDARGSSKTWAGFAGRNDRDSVLSRIPRLGGKRKARR